jgi:hypothetical protein
MSTTNGRGNPGYLKVNQIAYLGDTTWELEIAFVKLGFSEWDCIS